MKADLNKIPTKTKHHFVWSYYLRQWSNNSRDIWHTTKNKKIARNSVKGLSVEKNFYTVKYLSDEDAATISSLLKNFPNGAHKALNKVFTEFRVASSLFSISDSKNIEQQLAFKKYSSNHIEDRHSFVELAFKPIYDQVLNGNFSTLVNYENLRSFLIFFGLQLTRTKGYRERAKSILQDFPDLGEKNISAYIGNLWLISYLIGMDMANKMLVLAKNIQITFLTIKSNKRFITSDEPILSLPSDSAYHNKVAMFNYFYPLSPKLAVLIRCADEVTDLVQSKEASQDEIVYFNNQMHLAKYQSIYSYSREDISNIVSDF